MSKEIIDQQKEILRKLEELEKRIGNQKTPSIKPRTTIVDHPLWFKAKWN
jgi:hypothetical protein